MTMIIGQLVRLNNTNGTAMWGVVVEKYDSGILILLHNGNSVFVIRDDDKETPVDKSYSSVTPIFKYGNPVMVKKSLFGKYKFPY